MCVGNKKGGTDGRAVFIMPIVAALFIELGPAFRLRYTETTSPFQRAGENGVK